VNPVYSDIGSRKKERNNRIIERQIARFKRTSILIFYDIFSRNFRVKSVKLGHLMDQVFRTARKIRDGVFRGFVALRMKAVVPNNQTGFWLE